MQSWADAVREPQSGFVKFFEVGRKVGITKATFVARLLIKLIVFERLSLFVVMFLWPASYVIYDYEKGCGQVVPLIFID